MLSPDKIIISCFITSFTSLKLLLVSFILSETSKYPLYSLLIDKYTTVPALLTLSKEILFSFNNLSLPTNISLLLIVQDKPLPVISL